MGRFSEAVLERSDLPDACIVFGGTYLPRRARVVRRRFDSWTRPKGQVTKYSYAKKYDEEYLVCFNTYGAAPTLELLHMLKDGGTKRTFFIGSMYARSLPVGMLVLPDRVVDKAGIVSLDNPEHPYAVVDPRSIRRIEHSLALLGVPFTRGTTVSTPSVLHDVKPVKRYLSSDREHLGVEMELSTFHYFGSKLGLNPHGLLYVSDNPRHDVIEMSKDVLRTRMRALGRATDAALDVLNRMN